MAASSTDKFMKVGSPGTATTLSAPGYTTGDTTLTVVSTANWPTDTGVAFAIDRAEVKDGKTVRIEGTYCEFVGVVSGATSITSVSKVFGTDQDYTAGALTRVYIIITAERENRLVEAALVSLDQDGTLKDNTVDIDQMVDTGWSTIPQNAAYNASSAGEYRKIANIVYLRGQMNRDTGNVTSGDTLGTLPSGFRPTQQIVTQGSGSGASISKVLLNTNGTIVVSGTPTATTPYLILDLGHFTVD